MDIKGKALKLATQAEIQQAEFRLSNQELLLKQVKKLRDEAIDGEGREIDDIIQHIMESIAKTKSHKDMCEMMGTVLGMVDKGDKDSS